MELLVLTDRCVELLKEIQLGLWPHCFSFNGNDELVDIVKKSDNKGEAIRQYYKNKSGKDRFSTDEEAIRSVFDKDAVLYRLAFLKALTFYVLSPVYKIANKDEQLNIVKLYTGQDQYADVILNTVELFGEPIYVKDMENEFMKVCPDVDSIGKYLPLALSKYDDIKLPYRNGCSMNDLVFGDNNYSRHIRKAESAGLIVKEEAETILVSIWQIIGRVNTIADMIMGMYNKIKTEASASNSIENEVSYVDDAINKLCPEIIDNEYKTDLRSIFANGNNNRFIIIKPRQFTSFFRVFYSYWEQGYIPKKHYQSEYDLIINNFKLDKRDISKATINTAKNGRNWK